MIWLDGVTPLLVTRRRCGCRYMSQWLLWKHDAVDLKNNFHLANRQFDRLQRELKNDSFICQKFEEINFQKESKIIEKSTEWDTGYFMPYRGVVRKDKGTTQVRKVFNCYSSKRADDCLRVDVEPLLNSLKSLRNTKRFVLSITAEVFDPVGFICPFVVRIKKLTKEIWDRGVDWDSELKDDLRTKWERWYSVIR
ncbi:integrase catalytic domain-containing protein [Nephila pilipes]|uniref:Integrase catalytic domain-containing protein n=1 Tax=Nephila pilipes TaxID=299642 RepID=A0A8X6MXJ5_NEPPI|nr:integrase catalytic domain-containing protein [Nephila pilipes]